MQLYILTDIIITIFIISEEFRDQFAKNILSDVFYNILNYILNDIAELDLRLIIFYNYIAELPGILQGFKRRYLKIFR